MQRKIDDVRVRIRGFYALSGPAGLLLTATVAAVVLAAIVLQSA